MNEETKYTSMSQEEKRKKLKEESESKRNDTKPINETLLSTEQAIAKWQKESGKR